MAAGNLACWLLVLLVIHAHASYAVVHAAQDGSLTAVLDEAALPGASPEGSTAPQLVHSSSELGDAVAGALRRLAGAQVGPGATAAPPTVSGSSAAAPGCPVRIALVNAVPFHFEIVGGFLHVLRQYQVRAPAARGQALEGPTLAFDG